MHPEINSPDISKVYACVFRPVKSPMPTLYKHISLKLMVKLSICANERKRSSQRHRHSQGGGKRGHGSHKFLENIVILCFETRFSRQNNVIRLKSNILLANSNFCPPPNFWAGHATAQRTCFDHLMFAPSVIMF